MKNKSQKPSPPITKAFYSLLSILVAVLAINYTVELINQHDDFACFLGVVISLLLIFALVQILTLINKPKSQNHKSNKP